MIDKVSTEDCCLCGACRDVCPKGAISFTSEYMAFLYPQIDTDKCISCNLCESVCPKTAVRQKKLPLSVYAAKNKKVEARLSSTSGGVFSLFAEKILAEDGFVFGAAYQNDFTVKHICISCIEDLSKLRGSKYTQSDMQGVYRQIANLLAENRRVMFTGCPCQCAGLKSYLHGKEYVNLLVVEIACHGVPSPMIFAEYVKRLEKKYKAKIVSIQMRDKKGSTWIDGFFHVEFDDGKEFLEPYYDNFYIRGYCGNVITKPACYHCEYRGFSSGADLTIGDFWGIQRIDSDFYDEMGVSFVTTNTEKGKTVLQDVSKSIEIKEELYSDLLKYNPGLENSFKKDDRRHRFEQEINKTDPYSAYTKCIKEGIGDYLRRKKRRYMIKHKGTTNEK